MKGKKIFYIGLGTLGLFIIAFFAYLLTRPQKKNIETTKETELKVEAIPQGEIDYIPEEITFHFSKAFLGVTGIIINEDTIKSFLKISPDIDAFGKWTSEKTFVIHFIEEPKLDQRYDITLFKVPLVSQAESIPPIKISFKTPPFKVNSVYLDSLENKRAKIYVEFNAPPLMDNFRNFIKVYDSKGKEIKILDVHKKKFQGDIVVITVPLYRAPEKYKFVFLKGLESTKNVSLKENVEFEVPIGFLQNPLRVEKYNVEEQEKGYMVTFVMSAPKERKLNIIEKNLHSFIRISPPLSFRAAASGRFIYVFADFIPKKSYDITLKKGIRSEQSILLSDYKVTIKIPEKEASLEFLYKGRYFGKEGDWKIPLKVSMIDTVKINVTYMPQRNVLFWYLKDWGTKYSIKTYGEDVVRNYKIPIEGQKTNLLWINLKEILPGVSKGVYLVESVGKTKKTRYLSDKIAVVITDLSLVVKWYKDRIYVWAFNSKTLKPESNVHIEIRSRKNFLTGEGTTGANGLCEISKVKSQRDVYIIFAEKGDDWTYLYVPSLKIAKQNYDISGEDPTIPYLAYIYPERELYRPGEVVHFGVIIREMGTFRGISLPINVRIRDPRGKNALTLSGKTDELGITEFSFPTTPASPTGKYILELRAGDRVLYTRSIFVEAFVPQKLRVELNTPLKIDIHKKFPVEIKAEYLFGAPAEGEDYAIYLDAKETNFSPSGYRDFYFGMQKFRYTKIPSFRSEKIRGKLDEKGYAKVFLQVPKDIPFQGPVLLNINAAVSEGGSGRVTEKRIRKIVHQRPFYIGLKSDKKKVIADVPIKVKGVLLRPDGTLYKRRTVLKYRIYLLRWSYNYWYYYEDYYWDSRIQKIPITKVKKIVAEDGKFSITFTPKTNYDDYLVEVTYDKNGATTQLKIPGWGWWWYGHEREEVVESPEVIPIRVDKKTYDEGEVVNVEGHIPFEGKILWTCELDTIYYSELKEAKGEIAKWSFHAPSGISTVYVSALLIRSGDNYLVQRGFGLKKIRIRPKRSHLELKIDAPSSIKPGEKLVIKVKGGEKFKGTIALVDEGILQITEFKTPDPYEGILRDLRLDLNTAESFGWIVKRFLNKTGGGFAAREKEFPMPRFTKIVSKWSGIKESSKDGELVYKVKIPQYNGRLRIMVVGANKDRIGSAEKDVVVKSDVFVSPTIPRFMSQGDEFSFPITLINTTKSKKQTKIKLRILGAVSEKDEFNIDILPKEKKIVWVKCKAGDILGSIKIDISAKTGKERYHEDFEIPLYPSTPYITQSEYLSIEPGKNNITEYFKDFYPRGHVANLILSPIPALSRLNHLKYIIGYPYGCIEQTSTKTLSLLKLEPLLPVIAPKISKEKYQDMVNSGIRRIISMQLPSGGFSFWPGGENPSVWASAYATLVLIEAKKSGFFVPQSVIDAGLNFLDAQPDRSGFIYYVLARGGVLSKRPEMVERLISLARREKFDIPDGLWVCGAINEAGKSMEAKRFLNKVLKQKPPKKRRDYYDFYTPLQYKGMELYITEIVEPENPVIEKLLVDIGKSLSRESFYYTTQELAWSLLGIGMYAEKMEKAKYDAVLNVDGKPYNPHRENGILSWNLKDIGGKKVYLSLNSKGKLYLCIENTGFSKKIKSFNAEFNNLYLGRSIYTYSGNKADSAKQGDLLVVEIKVKASSYYSNTAIEAPIPAGLEIENPRIGVENLPLWTQKRGGYRIFRPEYVDIRDDRVILFGRVRPDTLYYYFLARAVTPGKFFFAPTRGVVMYNPDINGHTNATYFRVNKK